VFTHVHQHLWEKGSFPSVNCHAECQVQWNVKEDENIIDMVQHSPRTSTWRISARFCVPRMRVWHMLHTEGMYPYHIQSIQHLEPVDMCSWLELCRWINSNPHMLKAHFTRDGVNNKRNSQHRFSINVVSMVTNSLVCTFSCNIWQVIFMPTSCKMNCRHS
jgi:hypothetical protein